MRMPRLENLSKDTITDFVQKIIKAGAGVHELAHKIYTQPRKVEDALRGKEVKLTHKTQLALVKIYLGGY